MLARSIILASLFATAVLVVGCGSDRPRERHSGSTIQAASVVDLDKVLKIMAETLKEVDQQKAPDSAESKTEPAGSEKPETRPSVDKAKEKEFLDKFA